MDKIQFIDSLISELSSLGFDDIEKADYLKRRGQIIAKSLFGEGNRYHDDIQNVSFHASDDEAPSRKQNYAWQLSKEELEQIFYQMREHADFLDWGVPKPRAELAEEDQSNRVFVVHGHDEVMKQSVARVLEKLGLEPIILHEKPNIGRTIIEKFADYSTVGFAVVLLSPDDIGYSRKEKPENYRFRARQNVILELGYFLGKLGRSRVVSLFKSDDKFEMPTDYSGVLFVPFDSMGRWRFDLIRELIANGYKVNANKLLE
jgi:hypothetical protein